MGKIIFYIIINVIISLSFLKNSNSCFGEIIHIGDTIYANYANYNEAVYVNRLFPLKINDTTINVIKEERFFSFLEMNDTLVIVTDHKDIFDEKQYQLKNLQEAQRKFSKKYNCYSSNDVPDFIKIENETDTLIFARSQSQKGNYELELGIIKGEIKDMSLSLSLTNLFPTNRYNFIIFVHPNSLQKNCIETNNIEIINNSCGFDAILVKFEKNQINEIWFSNVSNLKGLVSKPDFEYW